jgi:xanthine dehydrogenase iron-sulfur cluster and FAD-binding subunit A
MTPETIPWNWQDTATLIGCAAMLALAFWLSRRIRRGGKGGCASGGCGTKTESRPVVIPESALSLGKRRPRG